MMETVIHDDCCCGDMGSPAVPLTDTEPCCDKAVILGVDTVTDQAQSPAKAVKSDIDPPEPVPPILEVTLLPAHAAAIFAYVHSDAQINPERPTYLITRRLRI
jgi:hypothetical protein